MVAIADEKHGDEKLELIRQISGLADGISQHAETWQLVEHCRKRVEFDNQAGHFGTSDRKHRNAPCRSTKSSMYPYLPQEIQFAPQLAG